MTTSTTFNVHFWLKKTAIKKDGTFSIYARITVDGERADLSTKQSVLEEKWCSTARRVKSKYTGAKEINDSLDAIYFKLRDCHKNLKDAGIVISAKAVKLNFLGNDKVVQTINDLIKFHNDFELKKLAHGTTKNYPSTLKYLKRFLLKNYNCSDLYLKKVDYTFVVNFKKYLRNCSPLKKSQPLGNNGIMKHMERLQKLTTIAFKHGWINNNPFSLYKLKFEVYDSPFLEQKEIDALSFIENNKDNPFFLYYCLNIPHANNEAGYYTGDGMEVPNYEGFDDKNWPNQEKGFAKTISIIDNSVAEIEAKLTQLGIAENTIVVFVSDNGPHNEGGHDSNYFDSNGIYRGTKRDLYEGGIRVPLIVKWPVKVKAGTVANNPVATWDFLSTFAEIVNAETPQNLDGVSFLPTLLGETDKQKEHEYLYWAFYELGGRQAVRVGDWKYVKLNVRDDSKPIIEELYNIVDDPSEANNVIAQNPEKVAELSLVMEKAHTEHNLLSLFSMKGDAETKF
jgi:hypothetical protein